MKATKVIEVGLAAALSLGGLAGCASQERVAQVGQTFREVTEFAERAHAKGRVEVHVGDGGEAGINNGVYLRNPGSSLHASLEYDFSQPTTQPAEGQ
jgi:hypothetical protein